MSLNILSVVLIWVSGFATAVAWPRDWRPHWLKSRRRTKLMEGG